MRTPDDTNELTEGRELLNRLIERFNRQYGGLDSIIDQFIICVCTQGAFSAELVLSEDLEEVSDLVPVQPWTIHFQRDGYSQELVPFQKQVLTYSTLGPDLTGSYSTGAFPFKRLNPLTFVYIPIDQVVDDPYGRPPFAPALQIITFYLQLLQDLRQSVHMAAWGRLHIKALEEQIMSFAPSSVKTDATGQRQRQFVKDQLQSIRDAYNTLQPDDAFISTDNIQIESVDFKGGTLEVDGILRAVERLMIRALKQIPVAMGSNEGTTETHGTVQMQVFAKAISSFQNKICSALDRLFRVALEVYGIRGIVRTSFEEVRSNDRWGNDEDGCTHWSGQLYDSNGKKKLCYLDVMNARLGEFSSVYGGATDGAVVLKQELNPL